MPNSICQAEEHDKDIDDNNAPIYLSAATFLNNLHRLYEKDQIYFYIGDVLIAINPYKQLLDLYSSKILKTYNENSFGIMPPHIFAIGDKAYRNMRITKQNQSIIIKGESGSGKTESTKYVLQYLSKSYDAGNALIEDRLIKSNLLLEAFGNATTIHNNNSSRFGEIIEVHFDEEYKIVGGNITYYLLEKTRVCVQSTDEKNFHIFYYLCVNAPVCIRKKLQLNSPDTYHYLNQDCTQTKQLTKSYPQDTDFKSEQLVSNLKLNDTNDFIKYDQIMNDIGISQQDKLNIYNTLAGILHLGNINFEDDPESTQNGCKIIPTSEQSLIITAKMLHVDVHDLWNVLLRRTLMIENTIISISLTVDEAKNVRDKLARTIYGRLFNQLVAYVNKSISFKSSTSHISIIDTIGFENSPRNSFEQFCINYCNEKIQQVFNKDLFEKAQLLFEEEGIALKKIDYIDNQDCINLFEDEITGWFHLLDEESKLTERQSNQFTYDVFHGNPNHSKINIPSKSDLPATPIIHHNEAFLIEHYSGNVVYSTSEFIDKNNDILLDSFIIFIRKSKNEFVKNLFHEIFDEYSNDNINYLSVGTEVRSQMIDVINKLEKTDVHFIICIKPNVNMIPNQFQKDQILNQLKKNGFISILNFIEEVQHKIEQREHLVRKAQKSIKMYLQKKKIIRMLNHMKLFRKQITELQQIINQFTVKKKTKKCMEILKPIKELILALAHQIVDTPITTKEFDDIYNEIVYLFDHHFPQIKQVVFAQENYDFVEQFKMIEVAFEQHKDNKEEEDKQLQKKKEQTQRQSIILQYQPQQQSEKPANIEELIRNPATSYKHPIVGRIYFIRQGVTSVFGLMTSTQLSSPGTNASLSLSSSSSKSSKSNKPNKHFCLVRNIEQNKVTILVITTFDGQDPTSTKDNVVLPMLSRDFLLSRLIAINKTKPFPGKKCITSKPTSNVPVMLHGYLVLIEAFAPNDTIWPEPTPEVFRSSDMQYIDFRLRKLANEEKLMNICNDDTDTSTKSTMSLPIARTIMNQEHDPSKSYTAEWLRKNMVNYDDEMMMNETSVSSCSSSKINIFQEANEDCLSHINILSTVDHETQIFNDVYDEQLSFTDNDNQPIWFLFNGTGKDLIIVYSGGLQEFDENISSTSIYLKQNEFIRLLIECQLSVKIGDIVKTVNLNRTCKCVYDLSPSTNPNRPIQMLCDVQIRNDRRYVIFRSLVKIYNNTTVPLSIINIDSVDTQQNHKIATIEVNEQYFVPIDLLYRYSNSSIYIAAHEDENNIEMNNCCSIDWENKSAMERTLKLKNGTEARLTIITESNEAYMENTDQLNRVWINLYIHSTLRLTNLLPIDIKCLINNVEQIDLKSSQSSPMTSGNTNSTLTLIIPSYDNTKWMSDPIDLKVERTNDHNEYFVLFHNATSPNLEKTLRMILRADTIHKSYRLSLYSPFWIFNYTELKLEFQIENNRTFIDIAQTPFLFCPEKFESETNRKGQLRLYGTEQGHTTTNWSEKFSLDVIRSIDVASCTVPNDRTYIICVDVVTCSSGLTKIVEFSPLVVIINKSIIAIEIVETVSDKEQDPWIPVNPEQTIPFWPRNMKDGLMRVRYTLNHVTSSPFTMTPTYRTLLRMDYEEHPALCVEVTTNGLGHIRVIFEDYQTGNTPLTCC